MTIEAPVKEPGTGLEFYELSQIWGHGTPVWPGDNDIVIKRGVYHARDGVLSQHITGNMQTSTHVNAPINMIQRGADVASLSIEHFFGNGIVIDVPKARWEYVTAADLDKAGARVQPDDIVLICTGWHKKYSDSLEYFGEAPGLSLDAAQWLVDRKVKLVGVDTAAVDHPMATSLALHRGGPLMRRLPKFYQDTTGRDPRTEFPDWMPAHRLLLRSGIPTVENVGGQLQALAGKRATFHAMPWRFERGDGCIVRLMGIVDRAGTYRIEPGAALAKEG
ncbi:cyclase family protein [Sphingobium sp.]|uniref:cyclase family protein n=1 Tax=Sphingobium sp. TaxID=1912891 RepID=UPI0028BDAF3E|nr:cyclase family protein [Sphingobium sp.]